MTSRVQKGGPIFRPVVKSRSRPDARQSSVVAEPTSTPPVSSSCMPPPATVPSVASSANPAIVRVSDLTPVSEVPSQESTLNSSFGRSTSITISMVPPILSSSNRSTPAPPALVSMSTPISVVPRPSPSSITPSPLSAHLVPHHIQDPSNTGISPPSTSSQSNILHNSGTENVPTPALTTEAAMKLQRTSSGKKTTTTVSDVAQDSLDADASSEADPASATKKRSKSRSGSSSHGPAANRKRKASTVTSDTEGSIPGPDKRKRRASSDAPRPRRSRGPSLPPYDPDADPGEELDPTTVTMASLCVDTGQGRVSSKAAEILSNHAAWKTQSREKRARMKALMELKKYGREEEAEEAEGLEANSAPAEKTLDAESGPSTSTAASSAILDETGGGFDYSQDLATSRYNVQVRIGPNGETIIDEDSLVVDRTEGEDTTNYTHVVESDHTKFVNSGSYGKRYRGSRWSAEETELFYDALSQYGENYELIAYVLPGRDRKSCKNKFKAEDKKNPARINHCLNNNIPVDMATLSRMTGKDFSGPVPEIRVPTPQPMVEHAAAVDTPSQPDAATQRKKIKKKAPDDGAMVVGDTDSFVPFPESP